MVRKINKDNKTISEEEIGDNKYILYISNINATLDFEITDLLGIKNFIQNLKEKTNK